MREHVSQFLKNYGMHYETLDLLRETEEFAAEMRRGLAGNASTLMMLPTHIEVDNPIPEGQAAIVLDAGGTHFRSGTLTFQKGVPKLEHFQNRPMPGTKGTITAKEFFCAIVDAVEPLLPLSDKIGFCFSYPAEITPAKDGKILQLAKEVAIEGAEGCLCGAEINRELTARGHKPCKIVLLNDTTAGMLGGMGLARSRPYADTIGFILGTGTNTCYIEDTRNIAALPSREVHGKMAVNLESGCYGKITRGKVDRELDAESANPGSHPLEKMVSGAYFAEVLHRTLTYAIREKLFSADFARKLAGITVPAMRDVDSFCDNPYGQGVLSGLVSENENDRLTLYEIAAALFERAVLLTHIQIGGILTQTDAGRNPMKPVRLVAEGSFFTKSNIFRRLFEAYAVAYLAGVQGRYIQTVTVPDATLTGAAMAALG